MPAPDNIPTLGATATFYDWFSSYNNNAVGKLNKMYVYDIYAGNGIGVTFNPNSGGYTLSLASTITGGVTFSGSVVFTNTVALSSTTTLQNISQGFSGDFKSVGVTVGTVVRVTTAGGLTLADASDRTKAEAIGVVTSYSSSQSIVTLLGRVAGASLTQNLIGAGNFSTGCVYFLSDTTPGRLTTTEPTANGRVSKPIFLATGSTAGIVIPFRGQYIDLVGVSGASGEGLDSIILSITPKAGEAEADFKLRPGSVIIGSSVSKSDSYNSSSSNLFYRRATSEDNPNNILGIVTKYITAYSNISENYILVQPKSSVIDIEDLGWLQTFTDAGKIYLDSDGNPSLSQTTYSIGLSTHQSFIFEPETISSSSPPTTGTTTIVNTNNKLINGSLAIWQRYNVADVSGVTWTSSATGGYFADRWCIINGAPGVNTFNIVRKDFAVNQTTVKGFPEYYFNLSGGLLNFNNSIENRTQDNRYCSNKNLLFSFYAKNPSGAETQYVRPYLKTYDAQTTTLNVVYGPTLSVSSSAWQRYSANMFNTENFGSVLNPESYFAAGLVIAGYTNGFPSSPGKTCNIDLAQFMLEEKTSATDETPSEPPQIDLYDEYRKCSFYYQRSYGPRTRTLANTISSDNYPDAFTPTPNISNGDRTNVSGVSILYNELYGQLYSINLPVVMRKTNKFIAYSNGSSSYRGAGNLVHPIKIYTPLTSATTEISQQFVGNLFEFNGFNQTANCNMDVAQGTESGPLLNLANKFGLVPPLWTDLDGDGQVDIPEEFAPYTNFIARLRRLSTPGSSSLRAGLLANNDGTVSSINVQILTGAALFDVINFHYVIDLDMYHGLT